MSMPDDAATPQGDLPLISLCIPVLNEYDNLDRLYERLDALGVTMRERCHLEFVFSDNQSSDRTWEKLQELAARDDRIRAIRFSKNVGFQRSILANYLHARGDAVMQLDADLQDPPEMLETFFDLWREGYQVVYGLRRKRKESPLLNWFRRFGYWTINAISEHPIPQNVGDFRLLDRKVVNALAKFRTHNPYLRGMISGIGFRQTGVVYDRDARAAGESKFGMTRLIRLGVTAVFNHSTVPLRMATILGIAMIGVSGLGAIYFVVLRLIESDLPRGVASIHVLVLFGIGLQSLLLGMIGEYILRIYVMLRAEPLAIIDQTINIGEPDLKL
ncbi:glycosyltransferase family 2 protein [Aurantimonas sp. HBX-1]|uniref:glycosyltransferase family 2 protein n=1 Tax=Aurantimonas sp. HBX-1 TaxID=2906072 RepID=UPI001F1DB37D|nr:glycosyltransferase family 2 protein [Aurantimonas sp. HBX-1]UIJ71068.1 glycosyltransferase family 2 protein [Aurantimonas sp. HBX-1]